MSAIEATIPDKLFYRINEVSSITQIKPYVLRYWETEFPMLSPEKDDSDQRRYRKSDIEMILQIKDLLYKEKFTIAGARKQLRNPREAAPQPVKSETATPVKVDLKRARRINETLTSLRGDIAELYRIMA